MRVSYVDCGNIRVFICSYYGWFYGINGELIDVSLEFRVYL